MGILIFFFSNNFLEDFQNQLLATCIRLQVTFHIKLDSEGINLKTWQCRQICYIITNLI